MYFASPDSVEIFLRNTKTNLFKVSYLLSFYDTIGTPACVKQIKQSHRLIKDIALLPQMYEFNKNPLYLPVDKSPLGIHQVELVIQPCPGFT
jgi:hypothetical protein